jgi:Na+-driven multidrug efflux pump
MKFYGFNRWILVIIIIIIMIMIIIIIIIIINCATEPNRARKYANDYVRHVFLSSKTELMSRNIAFPAFLNRPSDSEEQWPLP